MQNIKTKSIGRLEEKMDGLDEGSVRFRILESAKSFKTSWIGLGQALYSVWKDKLYKEWGYLTFEAYSAKEIGIRKETALKLLKSYYFLEKEEPSYLKTDHNEPKEIAAIPNYESVNVLRLAKNKKELGPSDYGMLKKNVFEMGKDAKDVKKDLTAIIKQRQELDPEEVRDKKRLLLLRRLVGTLKVLKRDLELSKIISAAIVKDITAIINKLEPELE